MRVSKNLTCALAGLSLATLTASAANAAVLVYEGFNGYTNGNINSQTAVNTTGLQGAWTVTNVIPSGGAASSVVQSTGLSFGANFGAVSGGSLKSSTSFQSAANASSTATIQLNASATGTLWGSYLVNFNTMSTANGGFAQEAIGDNATASTYHFSSLVNTDTPATARKITVAYDGAGAASGNVAFLTGTDYLFVSRYTNVGTTLSGATTGTATTWVFTLAGFDAWVAGGTTEATLAANAFATRSDGAVTSGVFNFDSTGYVTLRTDAPNFNGLQTVATYDEIRYGTTLNDVVPEPGSLALLGLAGTMLFRRRRNAAR